MTQTLSFEEYTALDGLGLADLIRRGEVGRAEVVEVAYALVERLNPELNAFVEVFERPLDAAPDGPFAGVPFVIKDIVCHAAGVLNENGSRLCVGVRATHDTALMRKYREAGLATLGRVATPEFGYCATTEPLLTGAVHNPWDLTRMPGGSSGASGAVVAAGIVPLAHANDGGGSIRIPAGCNGLVGLKPSRGRVSVGPDIGEALNGIAIEFAVTRTVRDCAALLDAVSGPSPGDPYVIAPPARPYLETLAGRAPRLKIALMTHPWSGCQVEPVMIEGAATAARVCEALGHKVIEAAPPLDSEQFMEATHCYWTANLYHWIQQFVDATGREPGPDTLEATTLACYEAGERVAASDLLHAMSVANRGTREFAAFFADYDVLLTPTTASPALPLGTINASDAALSAREWTEIQFTFGPFTPQFNMTGQPAISLPLHRTETDLPVGVQFVARCGAEDTLLMLAAEIETALPWPTVAPLLSQ
jgi:amidase